MILIFEEFNTFIDLSNSSEKLGLVEKSETLITIRELRNKIAHEYEETELNQLFKEVHLATPELLNIVKAIPGKINVYLKNVKK